MGKRWNRPSGSRRIPKKHGPGRPSRQFTAEGSVPADSDFADAPASISKLEAS